MTSDAEDHNQLAEADLVPTVLAIVVSHNSGPWLEDALKSLASQDYPNLVTLVVDLANEHKITSRVASVMSQAYVRRIEEHCSFGDAINRSTKAIDGATYLLVAHDDVAFAPNSVRMMVEEAFRMNASIVGPKYVEWSNDEILQSVGELVDPFGFRVPRAEEGELDQQQYEGPREVGVVRSGAVLIRADIFDAIEGYDSKIEGYGEDLDICMRARAIGGRVVVAPLARVRHYRTTIAGERPSSIDVTETHPSEVQLRNQLRSYSTTAIASSSFVAMTKLYLVLALCIVAALLRSEWRAAKRILSAVNWYRTNSRDIKSRRKKLRTIAPASATERIWWRRSINKSRSMSDAIVPTREVLYGVVRKYSRVAPLDAEVHRADFGTSLHLWGLRLRRLVSETEGWKTFGWFSLILVVLTFGSRNILFGDTDDRGTLLSFGESRFDLLSFALRRTIDADLFAGSTSNPLLLIPGVFSATFGPVVGRALFIVGLLILGPIGVYRIARKLKDRAASVVGSVIYALIPLGANAVAQGSMPTLVAYALAPWLVLKLVEIAGIPVIGRIHGHRRNLGLISATLTFVPYMFVLWSVQASTTVQLILVFMAGLTVSLLTLGFQGDPDIDAETRKRILKSMAAVVIASLTAFGLSFPWMSSAGGGVREVLFGTQSLSSRSFGELARFAIGPIGGASVLATGFLLVQLASIAVIRGKYFNLAEILASLTASALIIQWMVTNNLIGFGSSGSYGVLAIAAVGISVSVAVLINSFKRDVTRHSFGIRQLLVIMSFVGMAFASFPTIGAVFDGEWRASKNFATERAESLTSNKDVRTLWVGDAAWLPISASSVRQVDPGIAIGITPSDLSAPSLFSAPLGARLLDATEAIFDVRHLLTKQVGTQLGSANIGYVVLLRGPSLTGAHSDPAFAEGLIDSFDRQFDLSQIENNSQLVVYRVVGANASPVLRDDRISPAKMSLAWAVAGVLFLIAISNRRRLRNSSPVLGPPSSETGESEIDLRGHRVVTRASAALSRAERAAKYSEGELADAIDEFAHVGKKR